MRILFEQAKEVEKLRQEEYQKSISKAYEDTLDKMSRSQMQKGKGETLILFRMRTLFGTSEVRSESSNKHSSKNQSKKGYQDTFGQNVQKLGVEPERRAHLILSRIRMFFRTTKAHSKSSNK